MEKISAYKTLDGEIYEEELEAKFHEELLNFNTLLDSMVYSQPKEYQHPIKEFINQNKDELMQMFDKLYNSMS